HYAIFNNGIDHNLLEIIHDGGEPLTDELFFELLAVEPAYLGTVPFRKRISEWRELCLWPELHDEKEVATARSNLHKIGRVLARRGSSIGSPNRIPEEFIHELYKDTFKFLEKFFTDKNEKPSSNLLIKKYPEWRQAFKDEAGLHNHRTLKEIAIRLTQYRLATRESTQFTSPLQVTLKTMRKIIK
ncbi:MAG TPA: hypothetical protein VIK20_02750, partial [Bacteroidales bacterium]